MFCIVFLFLVLTALMLHANRLDWAMVGVSQKRLNPFRLKLPDVGRMKDDWVQIAAAAIPALIGLAQTAAAAGQKKQRPIYAPPPSETEALQNERRMAAMEKAPGTDSYLNQIRQQGASATQAVKELGGGSPAAASAVSQIYGQELDALGKLRGEQESYRINQQNSLNNALRRYGEFEDRSFEYNQDEPYRNTMAAKSALTNAAISNFYAGATNVAGAYGQKSAQNDYEAFLRDLYGMKTTPAGVPGATPPTGLGSSAVPNATGTAVGAQPMNTGWLPIDYQNTGFLNPYGV